MARRRTTKAVADAAVPPPALSRVRVAIYIRRSTDEDNQPFSLEVQETKLRAYIASQPGWELVAVYSDDASGAKLDRRDLQRALAAARAKRFDVFLVYRLDRFTRRASHLSGLLAELDGAGVAFRSATEPFDTGSPAGKMFLQMLAVFAEFERDLIIDRVISGMESAAKSGQWTQGAAPFGYAVNPTTHKLVQDAREAPVVQEMFRLYTKSRLGTRTLAKTLNGRGIRTRHGKPWSHKTIADVLTNTAYIGEVRFRGIITPDAHPAVIDTKTFDLAERILLERGESPSRKAAMASDYHLTGKITCPKCGKKYIGTNAHGKNRTYRYYTCFTRNRYGVEHCPAPRIDADALDQAILEALRDFYSIGSHLITEAIHAAQGEHRQRRQQLTAELHTVKAHLATTEASIDRYLADYETPDPERVTIDRDTIARRINELAVQARQLRRRRDDLSIELDTEPTPPDPAEITAIHQQIIDIITTGTPGERKALCEATIAELRITGPTTAEPVFKVPLTRAAEISLVLPDTPASRPGQVRRDAHAAALTSRRADRFTTIVARALTLPLARPRQSPHPAAA